MLTLEDRPMLMQLKNKRNLVGCEVGVAYGDNAERMLQWLDIRKLYLVDPFEPGSGFENVERAQLTVAPWEAIIVWLIKHSYDVTDEEIPDNSLDFVYIDAEHEHEPVLVDIKHFFPKVKEGGIIGGHDWKGETGNTCGVTTAAIEFFGEDKIEYGLGAHDWDHHVNPRVYDWWVTK